MIILISLNNSDIIRVISAPSICDIIGTVFTILLFVLTTISVYCAYRAYKHQKDRMRKDAACELAKYYSQEIIGRYTFINRVFSAIGLDKKIKDLFPYDKIENFDYNELSRMLSEKGTTIKEVYNILSNIDTEVIIETWKNIFRIFSPSNTKLITFEDSADPNIIRKEFYGIIMSYLNDLEWFAMCCRYNLADESLLYQSLHQTYLSTCWLLYFFVSYKNYTNEDKFYTNLTWLFNRWKKRLYKIIKKPNQKKTILEDQAKLFQNEAAKQKASIYSGKKLK